MAEFTFKEVVSKALSDYVGPPFPAWWGNNQTFAVLPDLNEISEAVKGQAGKGYFMTLTLSHKGQIFQLPNEPLVSLSLRKTIVETPTIGKERRGTVKEYICTEDYNITIKGICVNEDNSGRYPSEQVQLINDLFAVNDSLDIVDNKFFTLFDIGRMVLKSVSFKDMQGKESWQYYEIKAVSDQDFYAELIEKEEKGIITS